MKEQILNLLKEENDFISGQKISDKLGVSRTAIWKHINILRKEGYNIESVSNKGYKLISAPDILTLSEIQPYLKTSYIGRTIFHLDTIDSTNKKAKELASNVDIQEGCIVISEEQTGGKGRLGRRWISPKSKGIWMSIILKPNIEPSDAAIVTQIGAAAVYSAIKNMGLNAYIKWPNDIVINSRKVCGILTEMNAELSRINYIIMGMGINANLEEDEINEEIKGIATSLKIEANSLISRKELVAEILNNFEQLYNDFVYNNNIKHAINICKQASILLGKQISIISKGKKVLAKALDLNDKGELVVKYDDGTKGNIISGEVSVRGLDWYV
ncbi:biotin--[acetyl-CoA-carboxylase] ligase [Abyssisolibacter fermentans]|uniref:biotin--[acetyl-CoA-carboxylase] ligase n=1 Tax=Abyssisolibacter fermentans TaxID=1766203 RepID=UPI00083658A2|nr:biotin--[acetyl-CoA-carboxylase] ligase [Abyssisolibacter fermentans]